MTTKGTIKIIAGFKEFKTYNSWDSAPCSLGIDLVKQLQFLLSFYSLDKLKHIFSSLKSVSDSPPTVIDIYKLKNYTDLSVSLQSHTDWYCLLRECQGDLEKILDSGYILETKDDQEYNYVINLNDYTFSIKELNKTWSLSNFDIIKNDLFTLST